MIVITEPPLDGAVTSDRWAPLHPDRLPGFRLDGEHWFSPAHYCLARTLARPEDRERVRSAWKISEARALAAELPRDPGAEPGEPEALSRAVIASIESSLSTRALLLSTGEEP